ncbi:MAG: xanthine dehydrogenase family protein molybdopterin-binding subunit [Deltaproteobacteria bacterium]|nr:xanthine dehydrogenase family protein molybdopterin-binding subunit [Deltaproteobacteria bacterium]
MNFVHVGKDATRPDAVAKVTGRSVYLDDICLPGMLQAAILRPEHAHAKIVSIDCSAAETQPGVVAVVTGKGASQLRYGDNIRDLMPMAEFKVRHIGEAVAAVVAEDLHAAKQALKLIRVEYEPLPVYTDALSAMADGAALIHEESGEYWHLPGLGPEPGTNIANHYHLIKGDIQQGFAEADAIVEGDFNYPFGSSAAIEPHGAICVFHPDGRIEIWSSSICPFIVQDEIARAYGRSANQVRVHIPELGGCFGYKSDLTIEQTVAHIASCVPGRPVKWVASRKEDLLSTLLGHGIRTRMKIGARKDGKLTAIDSKVYHATGAYSDTGVHVCIAAGHNATGTYEFPHADLHAYLVYTNTPPIGAYRGYGHQESQLAIERLMDILARKLSMSPFALREKNYLGPGTTTALGEPLHATNGDVRACAEIVRRAVFSGDKPAGGDRYAYGRGFAGVMKSPKGAPHSSKGCYMKFNGDGSVTIAMGGAEVGQGLRTVVQQLAAERLKLPLERVSVYTEIDTGFSPWEWQTIGSMFTIQGGKAVLRAADKMIAMLKRTAAQALRCDEDRLDYDGDFVFLKSDPSQHVPLARLVRGYMYENGMTVGEVVQATSDCRLPRYSGADPATGQGNMGVTYTFGAQGCELKIDKQTGEITVEHFASAFDVGRVINPKQIRGQVAGGVMMGIGASLYEELVFDADGKCKNPHFRKYGFPTIKQAPRKQTIEFVENPGEIGPYGARGIGEHPVVGVAPAILNAIHDAIGVDFFELPIRPADVLAALGSSAEEA